MQRFNMLVDSTSTFYCDKGRTCSWYGWLCQLMVYSVLLCLFPVLFSVEARSAENSAHGLSAQVLDQLTMMREEKKSRTPAQRKMSSSLVHAVKSRKAGARTLSARLKSNAKVAPDGTTLVDIQANVTPGLLKRIKQLGGTVVNSFAEYNSVRARLPLEAVEKLAESGQVKHIRPASRAFLRKATTSEGDVAHAAAKGRALYSLTGKNYKTGEPIKVGVLSDSVDGLSYVQSLGDLPGVTVLDDAPGNSGEGTAMLEVVHDLAPDARLYFATGWKGKASFANNIKRLANAGCQVIVDDLGYLDESPFQDDIVSQAVNSVASQGVLYFSAAGNFGNLSKGTSGVWEGDFNSYPVIIGGQFADVHNFGGGDWANKITSARGCYTLFWSDPLGASNNDYDLYLVDPALNSIVAESTGFQQGSQDPLEGFCITTGVDVTNYSLLVTRYSGQTRFLHLSTNGGKLEYSTDGQISGHPAAVKGFAVAAVSAQNRTTPFTGVEQVETYSSDGPRRVFYTPNGVAITPGNVLSTGGAIRYKPDIAAADCVKTSAPGFSKFCGTSAAAPHAAAIAALMLSGKPDLTVTEARKVFQGTVYDIEWRGWDKDSGYGLLMADRALNIVNPYRSITGVYLLLLRGK